MKAIGTIVLLLVAGLAVATYFVTRPPDRTLDAQGRSWVADYETWRANVSRQVEAARVGMTLETRKKNARLIEPLRNCSISLGGLGSPPAVLEKALEAATAACGEAEWAVGLNDEFDVSSLASTKLHLRRAENRLLLSERNLQVALVET